VLIRVVRVARPWVQLTAVTDADEKLVNRLAERLGDDPAANLTYMLEVVERFEAGLAVPHKERASE
jgi:hypothetical protein